jgi:hypothetical protein
MPTATLVVPPAHVAHVDTDERTAAALVAADRVFVDIARGEFGSLIELCSGIVFPAGTDTADLLAALERRPLTRSTLVPLVHADGTSVRLDGDIKRRLDLHSRLLCGQWWIITETFSPTDRGRGIQDLLGSVTHRPEISRNSGIPIASACDPAKRAYNAFKMLGGGVPGWGPLTLDPPFEWSVR